MSEIKYDQIAGAVKFFDENGMDPKDVADQFEKQLKTIQDNSFREGFDAAIVMVLNSLDSQDSNEIAKFSVWEFIEDFKQHLLEEAELYKTDG